jgi:hypothetical protein
MNRLSGLILAGTLVLLLAGTALAGGWGSLRLARSFDRVAEGDVELYVQALQHDVHPLGDAAVTLTAVGPDGSGLSVRGGLDPTFGKANVYLVKVRLDRPGSWQMRLEAKHGVVFPALTFTTEVLPAGSSLPDPGPVQPYQEKTGHAHPVPGHNQSQGTSDHEHGQSAPAGRSTPVDSRRGVALAAAGVAAGGAGAGLAWLYWRGRSADGAARQ